MALKCEVCEQSQDDLICCASPDQAELWFCPKHYAEHVRYAHDGKALTGCVTLKEAINRISVTE